MSRRLALPSRPGAVSGGSSRYQLNIVARATGSGRASAAYRGCKHLFVDRVRLDVARPMGVERCPVANFRRPAARRTVRASGGWLREHGLERRVDANPLTLMKHQPRKSKRPFTLPLDRGPVLKEPGQILTSSSAVNFLPLVSGPRSTAMMTSSKNPMVLYIIGRAKPIF